MPPGGGYRAGSIYADLSFRLDDTGAAKFETRMRTARREAAKPVTAKLEADYDPRGLEQYERALKEARARAQRRQDFKAELGADFHPGAFREYERALQNADRNTRQFNRSQGSLGGSLGSFNRNVLALANSFRVLRWPAIIAGAGSAAAALSAAAGAATALTAALAPLGGALAAVPAGLSAFAQGLGALKLASSGVADAFKASEQASGGAESAMKKQSSAAEAVRSAQQGVKTAHEGVRSAQMGLAASERSAKAAQESLTKSRADATRQLEDMRRAVKRTSLDEESAVLAVREAREALNLAIRDPETSGLDIERAQLAVRQARQDLVDVRAEGANLRRENAKAQAGGVEKMPEVVDARRGLVDANRQVAESSRDVRLAQRDVAEAMRDVRLAQKDAAEAMSQGSAGVNKFADEMAKLPPAAQRFVRFLIGLKDEFQGLRAVTAQGLFPGVEKGITSAMRNLPILQRGLGRTAEAFGDLAAKAGEMVGSKGFGRDLETQMSRNERWIRRGGDTALNFAEALRDITIAAGPLVNWMTRYVEKLSETTEKQADASRKSGAMARFFEETRLTIDRLLRITADLAGALKNIGTIAYETLGKQLLGDLTKSADKFREWTASARGKNDIREYFEAITPAVYAFGRLVEDVAKAFGRIGQNEAIAPMLEQIRTEALPALETLVDEVTKTLGPAMVGVIAEFAQVLANLSEEGGALAAFISGFERVLELIKFITDEVPFIGTVLGTLAAAGGIYKALQVGATITGLRTIGRMIAGRGILGALSGVAGKGAAGGGGGGGVLDLFKGRGDTPAKPLYVAVVGSMPGGAAPGGIAKTIGAGAFRTFLTSVAMPAAPIVFAAAATWFIAKYGPNRDLPTRGKDRADREEAGAPSSGRRRQRSALSRNIEDMKPLENVPALNKMADALDRLAGTGKGGRAPQVKALGDRMREALREGDRQKISDTAKAMDKLAGNKDDSTSKTLRKLADEARKLGGLGTDMGQVRRQLGLTRNAFSRMSADGKTSIGELRTTVADNTRRIKTRLDEDSYGGRKALADNFREARKSVRQLMRDGVTSTRDGMREIRELLAKEMSATYGITLKNAKWRVTQETVSKATGGSSPGAGLPTPNQRGGRVKRFAAGGWLGGSKNLVGPDNIQISPTAIAAPGEYYAKGPDGRSAVINRHQAPVVDAMLQARGQSLDTIPGHASLPLIEQALGGRRALDGLFNAIRRPHMFQRGGIVSVPGFPNERANASVVGRIVAIAKRFGLTLTDAFGPGHESPGHTRTGTAADFSGPDKSMDAAVKYLTGQGYLVGYDGRFGSKNWPDHGPSTKTSNFHLHVELGGRTGGPISVASREIVAPPVSGGGIVGRAAQAGLRMTAAAANHLMAAYAATAAATPDTGGVGGGVAGGERARANQAIARRMMGRFGFGPDQWPALLRLWSGESNWDHMIPNQEGSGAYGIPQALPASKMASAGADWRTNPATQIKWGLGYIKGRYGTPAGAYSFWKSQSPHWYQRGGRLFGLKSGGRSYPLGKRGKVIGTPHSGTHTLGNWQSDNALDIRVPLNTPVLAVADGTVNKLRGSYQGGASRFDGYQVTLGSDIGGVFYTHLSRALVTAGENVDAGEMIGRSGAANGVPHLHIGLERGNARRILSAAIGAGDDDGKDGKGGKGKKKKGSGMTFAEARAIVNKPSALMRQVDSVQRFLDWMGGDRAQPWKPPASRLRLASGGRDSFYGSGAGEFHVQKEASEAITRRANRVGTSRDPKLTGAQKVVKTGVIAYDNIMQDIQNLNQRYSIEERKYGQSDEVLIDPTTGQVNQVMVTKRADELQALIEIRERIVDKIEKAQDMARQVVKGLKTIITRLTRSLKHAPNKDRKNIRRTIAAAQDQLAVFTGNIQELGYQLENAQLDVSDLVQERAEVLGTQAEARTSTAEVSADTQAQIAQAEERARVATERAEISERSLSVLGSPAGMNPQGIGLESGGAQIVINTLHPADPATLTAIAQASNKGNWYGGSVQSSRVVTGV